MEGRSGPTSHDRDLGLAGQTRRAEAQDDLRPRGLAGAATDAALQVGAVPMPAFLERVDRAPFVGRTGALRRLRRRWQSDLPANDGLVVVTGEPGIGKTRLVARFAAGVHAGGGRGPLRPRRRGERLALSGVRGGAAPLRRAPSRRRRPRSAFRPRRRAHWRCSCPSLRRRVRPSVRLIGRRRRKPPPTLRGCRPAAASRRARRGLVARPRGPPLGRRTDRAAAPSCAAPRARGRACWWSRRSMIVIRAQATRWTTSAGMPSWTTSGSAGIAAGRSRGTDRRA